MTDVDAGSETVSITVDGHEIQAQPGALIIDACEDAGVYIPRFCHHKRMNPVGMCRMCLVEVDTGRGPALQPSCMLSVSDGMIVDTESEKTTKAQDGVLEFLLVNHPLDCPVCDKGGECPLQDQTMAYGPGETRFIEEKRHFEKPIPINDIVFLDRERCILCDRCTRFASEVVGDPLIHFQNRGNETEVNTFPNEPFASYFSGNVVQICPVGALTAKPYRFKARPWDLDEVDSTYPDPMGDRINIQASRDQVLRFQGVDSDAVNWGWLADKERFAFEALQSEGRLTQPLVRGGGLNKPDPDGEELIAVGWNQAVGLAADAIENADPTRIGVLGGARMSNEAQYAWTKLVKGVIGTDNLDAQYNDSLPPAAVLGLPRATIGETCAPGGTIVLVGVDPKEELGTLYIRLRHAVVEGGARLIEIAPTTTGLTKVATVSLRSRPGEYAAVARALVSADDPKDTAGVPAAQLADARALLDGPVTVVLGRGSVAESSTPVLQTAQALRSLPNVKFLPVVRRGNESGALDMGMSPGLLPGRHTLDSGRSSFGAAWSTMPTSAGMRAEEIIEAGAAGDLDVLILLGTDPLGDSHDRVAAIAALEKTPTVIAVDLFLTEAVSMASVVLPAAAFTEADGSHTNIEGRITPLRQKVTPPGTARADWIIAAELAAKLGTDLGILEVADVWAELEPRSSVHDHINTAAIEAAPDGVLISAVGAVEFDAPEDVGSVDPIDGYSLRLVTTRKMYDNGTLIAQASSLSGLAGFTQLRINSGDFNALGVPAGSVVGVKSGSGSIVLPVDVDDTVPRGVAVIDYNRAGADVRDLLGSDSLSTDVRLDAKAGT